MFDWYPLSASRPPSGTQYSAIDCEGEETANLMDSLQYNRLGSLSRQNGITLAMGLAVWYRIARGLLESSDISCNISKVRFDITEAMVAAGQVQKGAEKVTWETAVVRNIVLLFDTRLAVLPRLMRRLTHPERYLDLFNFNHSDRTRQMWVTADDSPDQTHVFVSTFHPSAVLRGADIKGVVFAVHTLTS